MRCGIRLPGPGSCPGLPNRPAMRFWTVFFLLLAGLAWADGTVPVLIHTEVGDIEVAIDTVHAPVTARNFLHYVDLGLYDGGVFHRTVKPDNQPDKTVRIEVIQGG